jgi:hypothetical protein
VKTSKAWPNTSHRQAGSFDGAIVASSFVFLL